MIDYEYLTREETRVVAFGRWAGLVGAYNGLRGLGHRTRRFELKPAHRCFDLEEVLSELASVKLDGERFLVTGGGRVAGGALEILKAAGIEEVGPEEYLARPPSNARYTRLDPWHYTRRRDGEAFSFDHFIANPEAYESRFDPYGERTDIFIPCHFWDPRSPQMVRREHLRSGRFPIRMVADISCDIGEPIASTIRPSTIADPFYGYDPESGMETGAFVSDAITVMAVDNLPDERRRDAASDFGSALAKHVVPELLGLQDSGMLERATIASGGELTSPYAYLQGYLDGVD